MKMQKVYRPIVKVAPKHHPVLIQGESGTDKERVARTIHDSGPWRDEPLVAIDCGAFTGATQTRLGLLATAQLGTVLLDEVAELPVELQVKLRRALQEREFRPLGSSRFNPKSKT